MCLQPRYRDFLELVQFLGIQRLRYAFTPPGIFSFAEGAGVALKNQHSRSP